MKIKYKKMEKTMKNRLIVLFIILFIIAVFPIGIELLIFGKVIIWIIGLFMTIIGLTIILFLTLISISIYNWITFEEISEDFFNKIKKFCNPDE